MIQLIKQKNQLITICDACNGWSELAIIHNMTVNYSAQQLSKALFCHHHHLKVIIYDNETELTEHNFHKLKESYKVKGVPPTVK